MRIITSVMLAGLWTVTSAVAQTPPQTKAPGSTTIVINPTQAECQQGWNANLKWTKDQFDQFCSTLSKSK